MRKLFFGTLLFLGVSTQAQIYTAKAGSTSISFHSDAPMEDIEATNKGAIIVLRASTNDVQVRVTIENFKFKNSLMEEHFNENYMETNKKVDVNGAATYPNKYAEFKGKISETIDYTSQGEYKVTIKGKLTMHNVTKDVVITGTITMKGNEIVISSTFKVKVVDYEIKVPSMYVKNIAEEVDITINSTLEPLKK
jgi:polyisoprenoid-binding protein YceI